MLQPALTTFLVRTRAWTPSTRTVWIVFAAVHLWIAILGVWVARDRVFWDLTLYRSWVWYGLNEGQWPVLTDPWVYPAGALVPMLLVSGLAGYDDTTFALGWTALVTVLDAMAVSRLLRLPAGARAAVWWMAFLGALGAVSVGRLDALVTPLALLGLLAVAERPRVASVLLTVGAWIKVAPGALMLPVLLAVRRPWKDGVIPAAAVSAAVVGVVWALGGLGNVTSFLFTQGARGMQVEAVGASPWLVWGLFSPEVSRDYNADIITFEVNGPGVATATTVLDVAFFVATVVVALMLWRRRVHGPDPLPVAQLVARGSFLVLLTMIVTNKVLSPQYITWLAAPVAVALAWGLPGWRRTAGGVLAVAGATQIVFPWFYDAMLVADPTTTVVLVARNVALVVLWVAAAAAVLRAPSQPDALEQPLTPQGATSAPASL